MHEHYISSLSYICRYMYIACNLPPNHAFSKIIISNIGNIYVALRFLNMHKE